MDPRPAPRRTIGLLVVLCVLALGLRFIGPTYGLPTIYHPDTPKQIHRVPAFFRGDLVPRDTYPTLHMYVVALILKVMDLADPRLIGEGPSLPQVVITARLLNGLLGTGIVPIVYLIGRWLFDRRVGALAASFVAVSSLHVLHSHYEMGDIAQAFFVVASVAAAARVLLEDRTRHYLLAGALAGLAMSAKYYGILAIGSLLVAALPSRDRPHRRVAGRLALAGLAALGAFVLTTPMLLVTPRVFLRELRESPEFFPLRHLPPLLWRPPAAGQLLGGLTLEWLGPLMCGLALLGVLPLLRRRRPGALVLATPALVVALYVVRRANYLDDRYLVILVPFAALSAAAGAVWLAGRARALRLAAVGVAALALSIGLADSLHTAWLFRANDTREHASQWWQHAVPPGVELRRDAYPRSPDDAILRAGGVLLADSGDYERYVLGYSLDYRPDAADSLAFLARDGKLLKRFELLPRAFTSPTLSYYDLDSWSVPYAFPPPDDIARPPGSLTFVGGDMVPDHVGLLLDRRAATVTLVSRAAIPEVSVALSGAGQVRVRQGPWTQRVTVRAGEPRLISLRPWRGFPWFAHVYRIRVDAREAHVYARILTTPCDRARAHLAAGRWPTAVADLEDCRGIRWREPARLFELAGAQVRAGRGAAARRTLSELETAVPGLLGALADLTRRPDGEEWRERYRSLMGHPRWFWAVHTHVMQGEDAQAPFGAGVTREDARAGQVGLAQSGVTPPAYLKAWFPQAFLRGRYLVTFRLRGRALPPDPLATLSVVRHFDNRVHDIPVTRPWAGSVGPRSFEDVVLPVVTELEPVRLEARVLYHGRGTLEVDEISIVPDVRRDLSARLDLVAPVLTAAGARQ